MKTQPDSQSQFEARISNEFEKLGLDREKMRDDKNPPEIDREALTKLADRTIEASQAKLLLQFIARYKSWRDAYCEILVERFNASET